MAKREALETTIPLTKEQLYAQYGDVLDMTKFITSGNQISVDSQVTFESEIVPWGFKGQIKYLSIYIPFGGRVTTGSSVSGFQRTYGGKRQPKLTIKPEFYIPTGGGTLNIPLDLKTEFFEGASIQFRIISNQTLPQAGYTLSISAFGQMISSDEDTDADNIIEGVGDSIMWTAGGNLNGGSSSNPNMGDTHFLARICNQLKKDGISCWRNNRGFGGATMTAIALNVRSGFYGRPRSEWAKLTLLVINAGTNDAEIGTATSQNYEANLKSVVNYYFQKAPHVAILLCGQTPTDDPVRVTNLPAYRTIMQSVAASSDYTGKEIKYVDMMALGDPATSPQNYTETTVNSRLHPRWDTGGLVMYNQAYPIIQTLNFYTDI